MTIEIPDKIYRPCSTCNDDTCVFYGSKNTHEICTDYKDKKLVKAIEEMNNIDLNKYADNSYQLVNECIDILKRNIGE